MVKILPLHRISYLFILFIILFFSLSLSPDIKISIPSSLEQIAEEIEFSSVNSPSLDQEKLVNNTFLLSNLIVSGNGKDQIADFTWDTEGNTILAGITTSSNLRMVDSFNPDFSGQDDIFIMKISPDDDIIWSTYLGGSGSEYTPVDFPPVATGVAVAIDSGDNVIVAGSTTSTDFPTEMAFNSTINGKTDAYITKFYSNGSLMWSTFWGGDGSDVIEDIVIDNEDNIIVTGTTHTPLAKLFTVKLSSLGQIIWEYIPETGHENAAYGLAIDNDLNIIIVGQGQNETYAFHVMTTKLNSDGMEIWTEYIGGGGDDQGFQVETNRNNQILITGRAKSNLNNPTGFIEDLHGFIALMSPEGNVIWIYEDQLSDTDFESSAFDEQGNIIVTGEARFSGKTINEYDLTNSYLEGDDTANYSSLRGPFVSKLAINGKIIWHTFISYAPTLDHQFYNDIKQLDINPDGYITISGLVYGDEDTILIPSTSDKDDIPSGSSSGFIAVLPDPLNDEDGDFLSNVYEYRNGLNLTNAEDATLDQDLDDLTALQESFIGTNPWNNDTDEDRMPDGWEFFAGIDPLLNDAFDDPDGDLIPNIGEYQLGLDPQNEMDGRADYDLDEIPNYWEYEFGFDINNAEDANQDTDSDGLSNLKEFQIDTNPLLRDTDGDGEADGYEVDHNTDPLDPKSNYRNKVIIYGVTIGLLIVLTLAYLILNKKAKSEGYENFIDKFQTYRSGYSSKIEKLDGYSRGFKNKYLHDVISAAGFYDTTDMLEEWKIIIDQIKGRDNEIKINQVSDTISSSSTPMELIQSIEISNSIFRDLRKDQNIIKSLLSLILSIENFTKKNIVKYLDHLTHSDLIEFNERFTSIYQNLQKMEDQLTSMINAQKSWFDPWDRLLTLIDLTEDQTPISLKKIAKVINLDQNHTEQLLHLLLKENELIGSYDEDEKIYTKGMKISKYLAAASKLYASVRGES